jgi:hypothetical protein
MITKSGFCIEVDLDMVPHVINAITKFWDPFLTPKFDYNSKYDISFNDGFVDYKESCWPFADILYPYDLRWFLNIKNHLDRSGEPIGPLATTKDPYIWVSFKGAELSGARGKALVMADNLTLSLVIDLRDSFRDAYIIVRGTRECLPSELTGDSLRHIYDPLPSLGEVVGKRHFAKASINSK